MYRIIFIVRIPFVGGVNDNVKEIQNIALFLKPLNITKVELLPYHKMGEHKYGALNYTFEKFNVPDSNTIDLLKTLFLKKIILN